MLLLILGLAVQGLLIGALARLALPGKDPLSLLQTLALGLAGSFIAGFVVYAAGGDEPASFLAAFIVSFAIMYLIRRRRGGGLTHPGGAEAGSRERVER